MTPPPKDLERIYAERFSAAEKAAKDRIWQVLVRNYFQQWIRPEHTVLDLGCGFGEFLNHVQSARRIGVDLNPASPKHLDAAIEFHDHSVCELPFLADSTVDVVFTSNLCEHLPNKPAVESLLRESRRVLRPGGRLIAMGPNLRFLPGEYWDFWDHLVPITDRSFAEAMRLVGLHVERVVPRFLPYTTQSSLPKAPWLVALYLKMPWAWRFFGHQFLLIAQCPA